jgi:phospholipid/cholesterol/gamma-HCH transport system permease protein
VIADAAGVFGGYLISTRMLNVDPAAYWARAEGVIGLWDLGVSLGKALFFGAAIALISCHRGFTSSGGAEGVGRAATQAFVASFLAIIILDYVLVLFSNTLRDLLWPGARPGLL